MKKLFFCLLLLAPLALLAQEEKDLSDLSMPDLSKELESQNAALKAAQGRTDKTAEGHALGNIGGVYLYIGKKLAAEDQTEKIDRDKKANFNTSIDYSNKAIAVAEDVGDMDQLKRSYKNLSAAQKALGNVKGAMATYTKMMSLKKSIFTAKKTGEIEKKQLEYIHDRREDSIRKEQQLAEEHVKEQTRILSLKQQQLDSTRRSLSASEQEKASVAQALKKTQTDLTIEKRNEMDKEKKLTLAEEEQALQATNIQLQSSKLELQKSELQLQNSKMELQQNELQIKDRVLGKQRTYIYLGLGGILVLACFLFFIRREHIKAVRLKLRAERSERFKQEFIANISHEIRTPMNAINGMTGLMLMKHPRPDQDSYLKAISKSSDILLHVINDVLDLSKIEAGKLELEAIDFSMTDTIQQVKDTLSYRAEDKGLQLVTTIDDNLDDVLVGDPYRLNQVLINLGGNALKFTEKGGVHIEVKLEKKENGFAWAHFAISDTGIGIPADKVNSLFDSFSQVSSSDTRKYGGTGLGLSISKHLVELQGGKIGVESTLGSGTTFSFAIKYPIGSALRLQQRLNSEQNVDGSRLNGLRLLIADDNEYNRMVVNETLHLMSDVHTELVVNGQETVDMMEKNDYDIVLMDVQMPVMNGIDATKYIREKLPAPKNKIPIIALTASVLRSDLNLCFEAGMTAYVPKPFKPWQLINTIAEVTGRDTGAPPVGASSNGKPKQKEKEKESKKAPQAVEPVMASNNSNGNSNGAECEVAVTDLEYLRKFCEGDEKRMNKYIKVYLNALPAFSKNIEAAVATKDYTEIALHVHSFKPKWMMMGMKQTNELGIKIDQLCKSQNEKVFENLKVLLEDIDKSVKELEGVS